jgi:hypothetical protein
MKVDKEEEEVLTLDSINSYDIPSLSKACYNEHICGLIKIKSREYGTKMGTQFV